MGSCKIWWGGWWRQNLKVGNPGHLSKGLYYALGSRSWNFRTHFESGTVLIACASKHYQGIIIINYLSYSLLHSVSAWEWLLCSVDGVWVTPRLCVVSCMNEQVPTVIVCGYTLKCPPPRVLTCVCVCVCV